MATSAYIWRTAAGTNKFVCSYTGSDLLGTGTQSNPYKTLTKAFYTGAQNLNIVCRGIFNDSLNSGNSVNIYISGDYIGAAIWDGQGISILSQYQHTNMIIINEQISSINSASGGYGVGFGYISQNMVNNIGNAMGIGGDVNIIDNSLLFGCKIVGALNNNNNVYSRIGMTTYRVSLSGGPLIGSSSNCTIYAIPKIRMARSDSSGYYYSAFFGLYSQAAIYLDQTATFIKCLFSSDCTFWGTSDIQFIPYRSTALVNGDIDASVVTIPYNTESNPSLPTAGIVTIGSEQLSYTGKSEIALTGCTRGINGTSSSAHLSGTIIKSDEMASIVAKVASMSGTKITLTDCKYANQPATLITNTRINLYDSAVNWEYVTFGNGTTFYESAGTQFMPTGTTDSLKMDSIVAKANTLSPKCSFLSCRYTTEETIQLFNDARNLDFTLNPLSAGMLSYVDATFPTQKFYGAMKPALKVPIMNNSDGFPATWDEHTVDAGGLISVANNEIHFNEASTQASGQISTKVIEINTTTTVLDGLKAMFFPVFNTAVEVEGTVYYTANQLPIGKYIVKGFPLSYQRDAGGTTVTYGVGDKFYVIRTGSNFTDLNGNVASVASLSNSTQKFYMDDRNMVNGTVAQRILAGTALVSGNRYIVGGNRVLYGSNTIAVGEILLASGTTGFMNLDSTTAYLMLVNDPNIWNPVHVRMVNGCTLLTAGASLTAGNVCLNTGAVNVYYQGRTIVPKESFTVQTTGQTFSGDAGYAVGLVFSGAETWIPALAFDDFWNMTNGGTQVYHTDSNGNVRAASAGNPSAYAITGNVKNLISKQYIQFKIMLRQYDTP